MQRQKLSGSYNQSKRSEFDYEKMAEQLGKICDETEMVLILDKNGNIRFINDKAAQKKFKRKATHLIGRCMWELLEPEAVKRRKAIIEQVFQSRVPKRFVDERRGWWLDNMVYPLLYKDGKVKQVLVLARDITRFKEHERKIEQMNQKLEERVRERTAELTKKIKELETANEKILTQKKDFEDLNTTLRVMLQKEKEDIDQIKDHAASNMKLLIIPYLDRLLETDLSPQQQKEIVKLVKEELSDVASAFIHNMQSTDRNLTPKELQIADLIRAGMTTKKIASLCKVSEKTIDTHREHIRRKLGLSNRKNNLKTYLLSIN